MTKGRYKAHLQTEARRRLPQNCAPGLHALFVAVSKQLGQTWSGGKKSVGYKLLEAYTGTTTPAFEKEIRTPRKVTPTLRTRFRHINAKSSRAASSASSTTPPVALDPISNDFLSSYEWRRLRMVVLKKHGAKCQCCGSSAKDGVRIHVDHIKPRRTHPELALMEDNLQVLCEVCNHGKGNWDATDWRQIS